ncbi:hypothetical protein BRC2024_OQYPJBKP_CDS_0034 [Acinetobacter phage vB_AbaM_Highwayman]
MITGLNELAIKVVGVQLVDHTKKKLYLVSAWLARKPC